MPTKGTAYYNGPGRNKDLEAIHPDRARAARRLPSPYFCLVGMVTGLEVDWLPLRQVYSFKGLDGSCAPIACGELHRPSVR